jgi:hypothetical protein
MRADTVLPIIGLLAIAGVIGFFTWDRHRMCKADIDESVYWVDPIEPPAHP